MPLSAQAAPLWPLATLRQQQASSAVLRKFGQLAHFRKLEWALLLRMTATPEAHCNISRAPFNAARHRR